jgi:hypothetical protein
MDDVLSRIWTDLIGRASGPFSFRVFMQPTMAICFALRDGLRDARLGKPPYLRTLLARPSARTGLLEDGWHSIGRIILLAIGLDLAYQYIVFRRLYPIEMLDVIVVLAIAPYVLLRGPVNLIARRWISTSRVGEAGPK